MNIIPYNSQFATDFKTLNIEWLEAFFYVEPYDLEVLSNPEEYIINKGGFIFFASKDDQILGTVALMPTGNTGVLELTKMAVSPSARGMGIGQQLIAHCIAFAKAQHLNKLILYSHRKLENAIHIYKKWDFKEIPLEEDVVYKRANIKMELAFN
ncbi:GNAT family N-acetyltransferase [uncultured Dokdonia sp.]|mgnify:FL=1|uniref:GNAT family N-acetyltransferase n=1 Tax=uncultured Dokdonia sp. TaxID=575653 RepID=UPI0030EED2F5